MPSTTLTGDGDSFTVHAMTAVRQAPLTVGVKSMRFGMNLHPWDNTPVDNPVIANMIGNIARMAAWQGVPTPGYVADMPGNGIEPLLTLVPPASSDWPGLCKKAATVGKAKGARYYNVSNEPRFGSGPAYTAAAYAALTNVAHDAVRSIDPTANICAPVTTGNFADLQWVRDFLAASPRFQVFDFHPYYFREPEISLVRDIIPLLNVVRPRMAVPRFGISEVGYTTVNTEPGGLAAEMIMTEAQLVELYPRMILLHRGSGCEYAIYYMLRENGVGLGDYGNCYGVLTSSYTGKLHAPCIRETFGHVIAATGSANYNRGTSWITRLDYGTTQRLGIWSPSGATTDQVWITAAAAGVLTQKIIGGATTTQVLKAGPQQLDIACSARAKILSADVGITFPEFA